MIDLEDHVDYNEHDDPDDSNDHDDPDDYCHCHCCHCCFPFVGAYLRSFSGYCFFFYSSIILVILKCINVDTLFDSLFICIYILFILLLG